MNNNEKFIEAAKNGNTEGLKQLLGVVNLNDGAPEQTLLAEGLGWAANNGRTDTVGLLLKYDRESYANKDQALDYAISLGRTETAELLLKHGAEPRSDALQKCINNYKTATAELLVAHYAQNGNIEKVRAALDNGRLGISANAQNGNALREAAQNGHTDIVKLLLDKGADIHAQEDIALRYAAQNGQKDVVTLLLDRGANVHAANDYALRWAAANGHTKIAGLLLDYGANIHAEDDDALGMASRNNQTETVRYLLKRGALIDEDIIRRTAKLGHTDTLAVLKEHAERKETSELRMEKLLHAMQQTLDAHNKTLSEINARFEQLTALVHKHPGVVLPEEVLETAKRQGTEEAAELLETIKLAKEIHAERSVQVEIGRE